MILRSLRVQGFRCFRNPVELRHFGIGAHVIFAPNESGKSTLILALARALFDRNNTTGVDMSTLRPWGTTLSPEVHAELETKGKRYLLKKSFLDGHRSELLEWNGFQFEPKDEGDRADERVRAFFLSESTGRGATKVDHWGMARVLWLTQRKERMELPGVGEPLRQRLLSLVGVSVLSDQEQRLIGRIDEAYGSFFTATGKAAKNNPLAKTRDELRVAEEAARGLRDRLTEAEQWGEQIQRNEQQIVTEKATLRKCHEDLEVVTRTALDEERLEREIEKNKALVVQLQQQHDDQQKRLAAVREDKEKLRKLWETIASSGPTIAEAETEATQAEKVQQEARMQERKEVSALEQLEQERERARDIERAEQMRKERNRLQKRALDAIRFTDAIAKLEQGLTTHAAPKDDEIRKCEDLQRKMDAASTKLERVGLEVTFVPDKVREVEWEGLEREVRRVPSKERAVFRGTDRGILTLVGVGTVEIRNGLQDAADLEKQIENWRKEHARILGMYRVENIEALRKRRDSTRKEEIELNSLRESLADRLGDESELETLHTEIRKRDGIVAELASKLQISIAELAEMEIPDRAELDERWKASRPARKAAEQNREKAEERANRAKKNVDRLKSDRDGKQREADTLEGQLKANAVRFGDDEALEKHVATLAGDFVLARSAVTGLEAKLPPPYARAAKKRAALDTAISQSNNQITLLQSDADQCQGRLEQAAGQGLYSQLARAEELVDLVRENVERLERRAIGIETLRKLALDRKESTSRSLVLPIENEIQMRLDYIRGATGRGSVLTLSSELGTAHVRQEGGEQAPLDVLSWGTQEQVMLCLRLAMGSMLAKQDADHEPQIIVLDDALANTDDIRHARALELIEEAAARTQIIILTAFPDRYRRLGAREYDLRALAQRGAVG